MPIEIKELHIKMMVEEEKPKANTTTTEGAASSMSQIVAECVEQVLTILKEKAER